EALNSLRKARPLVRVQRRSRAMLGISGETCPEGLDIRKVLIDSPADRAGFRTRDILVKFNGERVTSIEVLINLMVPFEPGQTVEIELLRGSETVSVQVELSSYGKRAE